MTYKLLAADMDGTALTTDKRLTERTVKAMEAAIKAGKQVLFSTGRSISLIRPYLAQVEGMRYAITASGGTVIDLEKNEFILHETIDAETVKMIISEANGRYVFPILFRDSETYGSSWCVDNLEDFGLPAYQPIYRKYMHLVPDAMNMFMEDPGELEKFNLFFGNDYEAGEVYEKIKNLPISFTTYTKHSLEINTVGVSKARGLKILCERLGIKLSECIAVGDAENDEEMISCAGLKVAMSNGSDKVKSMADVIADDNDNDGVAKIIEQYLLD